MVLPGETVATGAPVYCEECKTAAKMGVYKSPAGHYIGYYCNCGPYSRESEYYPTRETALYAWKTGDFGR